MRNSELFKECIAIMAENILINGKVTILDIYIYIYIYLVNILYRSVNNNKYVFRASLYILLTINNYNTIIYYFRYMHNVHNCIY